MSHRNDLNELTENAANRETWQDAVSDLGSGTGPRNECLIEGRPSALGKNGIRLLTGDFRWRDPDSNRGHHDLQSCRSDSQDPVLGHDSAARVNPPV